MQREKKIIKNLGEAITIAVGKNKYFAFFSSGFIPSGIPLRCIETIRKTTGSTNVTEQNDFVQEVIEHE